ncbi:MAG: 5-(carboxyamino)imidazole ribonucleotide synthase [Nitrospirales bacterium]
MDARSSAAQNPSPAAIRIEPGAMVGVLGGGQLGAFFAQAARRMGYRVAVWDPDSDAPALRWADLPLGAPFEDDQAFHQFAAGVHIATYEWENVPSTVVERLESRLPVRPSGRILRVIQDRLKQKRFLADRGFPVARFRAVAAPEDLAATGDPGFPCLCKTATSGYDGKGQWRLNGPEDLPGLQDMMARDRPRNRRWVLEEWLAFEKELSVVVVRGQDGESRAYPVSENVHEDGILRVSRIPAALPPDLAEEASHLATAVVEALEGIGVFCVELFFLQDGRFVINEVAPRPHNSGHYSLDACTVSQFEQQLRALCGLPLGEVQLLRPALMLNLIGDDVARLTTGDGMATLLATPGAQLHLYGKREIRSGRKMGHVTVMAEQPQAVWQAGNRLWHMLHPGRSIPVPPLP